MSTFHVNNFYGGPRPLTVNTQNQKFAYDDDDEDTLDDNILDQHSALDSGLEMSPPIAGSRRQSYALSSAFFSPKTKQWQTEMQSNPSNNPFVDHNNSFMPSSHASTFAQPSQVWLGNSGSCTPLLPYDGLPADSENNALVSYRPMQGQTPFGNAPNQSLFSPSGTSNASTPTSPQKDWMSVNPEHRHMPKRMRQSSVGLRSHSPLLRRDGIRKKNARFDIPAERTLLNIDQLIAQTSDEQVIKELKMQKRLLRNRQAALDSRSRKKQHTERLEEEKKNFTQIINEMEDAKELLVEEWARKEEQYQHFIHNLQMEKEEMIRAHTLETGDLRKKVSVLTEHVQKMESTAMSAVPSSTGYSADYSDLDGLAMDDAWNGISFLNEFDTDSNIKQEATMEPTRRADTTPTSEQDKPAAQGLLLMLLLFGAFVASKGSSPTIPRMSDDVRAASATLLEDIFKDAGVPQPTTELASGAVEMMAPLPSGTAWFGPPSDLHVNSMMDFGSSALGDYADSLSQPTEEQRHEQLFSLSAAQYNGVASHDFRRDTPVPSTSSGRRKLADSLAAMRLNSKHSAAEVYTRSLLESQIPDDVVRNFAKMVFTHNSMSDQDGGGGSIG